MFTIVDNIVDALTKSFVNLSKRRCCVNVLTSLIMIVITASAGLLHTTKVSGKKHSYTARVTVQYPYIHKFSIPLTLCSPILYRS